MIIKMDIFFLELVYLIMEILSQVSQFCHFIAVLSIIKMTFRLR